MFYKFDEVFAYHTLPLLFFRRVDGTPVEKTLG